MVYRFFKTGEMNVFDNYVRLSVFWTYSCYFYLSCIKSVNVYFHRQYWTSYLEQKLYTESSFNGDCPISIDWIRETGLTSYFFNITTFEIIYVKIAILFDHNYHYTTVRKHGKHYNSRFFLQNKWFLSTKYWSLIF